MNSPNDISGDACYVAAWYEISARITTRDVVLTGYMAAAAALVGVALGAGQVRYVAVVVPYLGFFIALLLTHHNYVISRLTTYLMQMASDANLLNNWHLRERGALRVTVFGFLLRVAAVMGAIGSSSYAALMISEQALPGDIRFLRVWDMGWPVLYATMALIILTRAYRIRQLVRVSNQLSRPQSAGNSPSTSQGT